MKRREILIGGLAAGVGVPFQSAHGQASAWPSREVKVILPVSAGGAQGQATSPTVACCSRRTP